MVKSTKIKICGLQRKDDVLAVNEFPPDYVGFVFAVSRRQVDARTAFYLRDRLNPGIQAVGVFVNQSVDFVADLCKQGVIDLVQLHGDEDTAYIHQLRGMVKNPIIRSVAVGRSVPPLPAGGPQYLLFDAASPARGGTGKSFDWDLLRNYSGPPFFLAGGLDYNNVKMAIRTLQPYAVDVSSGVEVGGKKNRAKIQQFVRLVRGLTWNTNDL